MIPAVEPGQIAILTQPGRPLEFTLYAIWQQKEFTVGTGDKIDNQ